MAERQHFLHVAKEVAEVLEDDDAEPADKERAIRKAVHAPFVDLDAFLSKEETAELEDLKGRCCSGAAEAEPESMQQLQRLLAMATERRIEQAVDEIMEREDDVVV